MNPSTFCLIGLVFLFLGCKNKPKTQLQEITPAVSNEQNRSKKGKIEITPIQHASMVLNFNGHIIYVDPVGGKKMYETQPEPELVLITHEHPDHFDGATLTAIVGPHTKIIAPKSVAEKLSSALRQKTRVMENGENETFHGIQVVAIPMYNLRPEAKKFHPKGDGNGYVLSDKDTKIYIAGDTGDIPEMRQLKNIDIAFIPMNLPYTMPVAAAADAVLDFKPKKVYPYHYRGKNGLADVDKFENIIETNSDGIEVIQLDWYPEM